MTRQPWGWLGGVLCLVSACGGRAASATGSAGAAGHAPSEGGGAGASDSGGAGGSGAASPGCTGKLTDVSKALGIECPGELCAGTVAALACDALPAGVLKTGEAACEETSSSGPSAGRLRTLSYQLSATQRKECYYDQANFEALSTLVGAQAWDGSDSFCAGSASRISAGTIPDGDCEFGSSATLCDLTDPAQSAPVVSGVPARACFNGWSATCEPCCEGTVPDCTNKPDGYPGFDCTPPPSENEISYCSCNCDSQIWSCAC